MPADRPHDAAATPPRPPRSSTPRARPGASKGAILTHGNFAANALAVANAWKITSDDRYLAVLPLFHVHGLGNGVQTWLAVGCHMRLVERFEAATAAELFEAYRPTLFFGVPTMYVRLLDVAADRARTIGAHARLFVSGSAPLPAQVHEAFRAKYGHVILERYGMTETLMNASNPYRRRAPPGHGRAADAARRDTHPRRGRPRRGRGRVGRALGARPERLRRILAPSGRDRRRLSRLDRRGFDGRLVPHRRHRHAFRRWVHHARGTAQRPDHLRRIQHLSARDRGTPARSARRAGSDGRRRAGPRPR